MPLPPDIVDQVLASCRQNAAEAAQALTRALGGDIQIDPSKIESFPYTSPPPEWNGPGLVLVLKVDEVAALVLMAASSGLVPEWSKNPDPTGQSKLTTLAQELGGNLLPEAHMPVGFAAGFVENLAQAVSRGGITAGSGAIHCVLQSGDKSSGMRLLWPASKPDAVFEPKKPAPAAPAAATPSAEEKSTAETPEQLEEKLRNLPTYIRSLLQINVPLSVVLASTKQPVTRILNIGPGSIIQFEKNCEQPLTLCVGHQAVAEGEAVKVGEKFGIKITSMILPGERFFALRGKLMVRRS